MNLLRDDRKLLVCPLTQNPALTCCGGVRSDFPEDPTAPGTKLKCRFWDSLDLIDPDTNRPSIRYDCTFPIATLTLRGTIEEVHQTAKEASKTAAILFHALPPATQAQVLAQIPTTMLEQARKTSDSQKELEHKP